MIQCIWNIFTDTIIPIGVAIFGVYIAEHFARKRDYKQKQIEIQIDYMRKEIEYLSEMENLLLELSRQVDSCLATNNIEKRTKKYNMMLEKLSELNVKNLTSSYMLDCYNKAIEIEIDIQEYKNAIGKYTDNLKAICDRYCQEQVTQQSEYEINKEIQNAKCVIENAIRLITNKMIDYLKNM